MVYEGQTHGHVSQPTHTHVHTPPNRFNFSIMLITTTILYKTLTYKHTPCTHTPTRTHNGTVLCKQDFSFKRIFYFNKCDIFNKINNKFSVYNNYCIIIT